MIAPPILAHTLAVKEVSANVAILPKNKLKSNFPEIIDDLNYFVIGGDVERAEFSAAYYYLAHQPATSALKDLKTLSSEPPVNQCPVFPTFTPDGINYPESWEKQ